jgi:hypothetical protein
MSICTLARVKGSSPKRRTNRSGRLEWLSGAPAWLSALAALAGTFLAAAALFGWVNTPRPASSPTAPVASEALNQPRVTLDEVSLVPPDVAGAGQFENLDPELEEVLFVGRPVGATDELWVAVPASLSPTVSEGPLQSGHWTASRPAPPPTPGYRWRAIVWPIASGAAGVEDLQINGPDSIYVIARSEEWSDQ